MSDAPVDPAMEAILKRRAEQLAKLPLPADTGDEIEVLKCRLGREHYAVETRHLRAVQWATGIVPVPSTPRFVLGIVSVRGEIVTLLDLAVMIGIGVTELSAESTAAVPVLLVGLPGLRCGLVVDEVLGVERFKLNSLQPSLSGREFARGVGPDNTVLLDVEQLFNSGRFTVADEA
ncbi:MAG TPA: chemotaxis protein CheW [Chloroflexota bacterium]|jgi:purine-binding chemotaxis protein CheW|nr:chemotaxis protein CheW [Chloroflexota bacterium]